MLRVVIILLFIFPSIVDAGVSDLFKGQKEAMVEVDVIDGSGKTILSGKGYVIDREGLIATNCLPILSWYRDIKNDLIVKTKEGRFPLYRLISYNQALDLAIFKIADSKDLTPALMPANNKIAAYIEKTIKVYKDMVKTKGDSSRSPKTVTPQEDKPDKKSFPIINEREGQFSGITPWIKANEYANSKRYREAIDEYYKALKIEPHNHEIYLNLGLAYYRIERYRDSIDAFNKALLYGPPSKSIYDKLGSLYLISGDYDEAIEAFKNALSLDSKDPMSHFNLAIAIFMKGDRDKAWQEYVILREIDEELARRLWDILN